MLYKSSDWEQIYGNWKNNILFLILSADIASKSKFHISIGHESVLAKLTLFGCPTNSSSDTFPLKNDAKALSEDLEKVKIGCMNDSLYEKFDIKNEYKVVPCISCDTEEEDSKKGADKAAYGLLEFERPVVIVPGCKGKYLNVLIKKIAQEVYFLARYKHHLTKVFI